MWAGCEEVGRTCFKVKRERHCEWLLFSSGLIYLAQMFFSASFYVSILACVHTCVCVHVCEWSLSLWPLSWKAPYHTQTTMQKKQQTGFL